VLRRDGAKVDFRSLIHTLPVDGRRLDPGDSNAYRCASGMVLTCDEAEAEIATPPLPVVPGFPGRVSQWSAFGEQELRRLLPGNIEVEGYSTHLSAAMPGGINDAVCALYARTFAPALMLLIDQADSYGIFIRPRPGRAEFCGDFVNGERLRATSAFVAGSARACSVAVSGKRLPGEAGLPPELEVSLGAAPDRFGLHLARTAFGEDLYRGGRSTVLRRATGGTISAQEQLEVAWRSAREALNGSSAEADLATMDRIVARARPLGIESSVEAGVPAIPSALADPLGRVVATRARPGFNVECVVATWDCSVFRLATADGQAYVLIPRRALGRYLEQLDAGTLDEALLACLAEPGHAALDRNAQTREIGVFGTLGAASGLLAVEREPSATAPLEITTPGSTAAPSNSEPATHRPGKRPGKRPALPAPDEVPSTPMAIRRRWSPISTPLIVALTTLILLAGSVTTVFVASGREGSNPPLPPTATSVPSPGPQPTGQSGTTTSVGVTQTAPGGSASPSPSQGGCPSGPNCPSATPVPSQPTQGGGGCTPGPNCPDGSPSPTQGGCTPGPNCPNGSPSPTQGGCTPGPNCPNGSPSPTQGGCPSGPNCPSPTPTSTPTPTAPACTPVVNCPGDQTPPGGCTPGPNCPNGTPLPPQPTPPDGCTPGPNCPNGTPQPPQPTPPNQPPPQPTPACTPDPNNPNNPCP
jgi:hypothetical protein